MCKITRKLYSLCQSRTVFIRQSFLICPLVWEAQSPWPSDNLRKKDEIINVLRRMFLNIDNQAVLNTDTALSLTFSVVRLRSGGDEDPGQAHQQRHHQVDGHPRVQDLVLRPHRPAAEGKSGESSPG